MGSVMFLCLLMLSSICFGNSSDKIIDMECQSAVGVIGQTTHITCSFKTSGDFNITIHTLLLKKGDEACFVFPPNKRVIINPRFKVAVQNKPSLLLSNTSVSDEGEYKYTVITDRGVVQDITFGFTVTAKFNIPVISSVPEEIKNSQKADLYCSSSGGYPAGTIHWFDHTGTNWTSSSTLVRTEGEDKLLLLSSKLSFTNIDVNWIPFKCVVLNSKGMVEEESMFHMKMEGGIPDDSPSNFQTVNVAAAAVVIGSLIVGLLLMLLLCRRRARQHFPVAITDSEQGSNNKRINRSKTDTKATEDLRDFQRKNHLHCELNI
ncbi:uncharacterized protein zgc:174863 [Electrophorus electricus]|uniref:Ig-like domain-containing protein n=1 Tax=Electrophorus electricus TaxID=8005 RepID=A0A4W4H632_ELEEL|nr:uncharacterized protein zgc:174863 [Electrophorus electricus]